VKSDKNTAAPDGSAIGGAPPGPFNKRAPIRVSFSLYIISVLLVGLLVFIFMLVQYLPGYRTNHRLEDAINGADYVYVGIRIPKAELLKREVNPLTKEVDIQKILEDMGVKRARAEINPDRTKIPYENKSLGSDPKI